ncbi:MFS transporter, MHS family, dicarboxylic acid transporter PcaT [Roseateles sp. YR242]|uniref:MFS family transporter n=1 Tax=Roseateles sp. YR242 TaxID=1855305 RepID=UPI0008BF0769|nr:MFS family transporter [Roseateles sp. YR242]SEL77045.1 MFS transporter, MHS family, dicarboxylic acid transporter PcaT [Roseateles sp. YR242]
MTAYNNTPNTLASGRSTGHYTPHEKRNRILAIVGASSGNLVEWFDFYVYAFTSIYFAHAFFPKGDPIVQQLSSAAVFALGFLMRPIGGWLFGRIADRKGRKTAMMISVLMMCGGSLTIALMPTYETIGVMAPALLLLARLFQGLSVGGEYGTSATYMSEVALRGQRGFYASFQYVTLIGGQLLAVLVVALLEQTLTDAQLHEWGWRIPFIAGALTAVVAFYLRRSLNETAKAEQLQSKESGSMRELFKHHGKAFLIVLGFTAGGSLAFYTYTTYMQKYLVLSVGMDKKTASTVMTAALFVYMCMQPLFGALSDRIGRRTSMLLFGLLGMLATWPILTALKTVSSPYAAFGLIIAAMAIVSLYTSIGGLIKAEMFPPHIRALGVGLSYAIGNAIFGGSAEAAALYLKTINHESLFYIYVSVMCGFAFLVCWLMPDLRKTGYLNEEH